MNAIKEAIAIAGSVTNLAKVLEVTPQAVCFWRDGKRALPADKCLLVEKFTGGVVSCEQLRPDVAWAVIRNQPEQIAFTASATPAAAA